MSDGKSFRDPVYDKIEAELEKKYNLPRGGMSAIRTRGERSNSDQISPKGAATVYQIIPSTRQRFKKVYGIDAYASKEAAAEVAALHLRDDLRRYRGDWNKAVAAYNGGAKGVTAPVKETRDYVRRVTGQDLTVPAGTSGATQLAPGINISELSYDDLKDVAPEDIGSRRPLGPQQEAPKKTREQILNDALVGGRDLTVERPDQAPDISVEKKEQAAATKAETERAAIGFTDRLGAAIEKNWVLNQIINGIDRETFDEDPEFHDFYVKNIDEIEKVAETPAERDAMREATSRRDLTRIIGEITAQREQDKVINSNGTGLMFELGTALTDPVGWVATAGVGKIGQLGWKGYTLSRAALEGAAVNVGLTASLDYSGRSQTGTDYLISGVTGLALGGALYPLTKPSGALDDSLTVATDDILRAARAEAADTLDMAKGRAGPEASKEQIVQEVRTIQTERVRGELEASLADVGDESKFLTADEENILTRTPGAQAAQIAKSGLDAVDDAGERALVAEITARSEQIVANNPIDAAGLQGRVLQSVGQESTGLTMLRSKSPVMQAAAIQLLETTTGAGGRRRTAAMSQVVRERVYMRHMIEYEQMFNQWRKAEGKGWLAAHLNKDVRDQFDREVFFEVEKRYGQKAGTRFTNNNAVARAADAWERGMAQMAAEQRHVGTLGSLRLPTSSVGYMRHVIESRQVMKMDDAERRTVEGILAKQFNALNEYSYIDKVTKEKVTKNFDPAFSRKLAKAYLTKAMRRGNGSYDVPVNIHSSEGADIIDDALKGLSGLDDASREAILGKFSRGGASYTKGRLRLDLTAPIGPNKVLGDLFRQDIMGLYRTYARRASGEVALAQYGVYGKKGLDLMREAAERTGASANELKAFDQVAAEFLNTPYRNAVRHAFMDNVRIATSAARLGGMGFTQLGEYSNGLAALGAARVMSSIKSMPRLAGEVRAAARGEKVNNPILASIDDLGGSLGSDAYQMTRMFDLPDQEVQLYNDMTVGLAGRFLRGGSHMVSVMSGHRIITGVQTRGMAEQIVRKAVGYIKNGKESKALLDMGFTREVQADIRKNLSSIAKFDKRGKLVSLDLMAGDLDPNLMMSFRDSVERGASQIIQRTYTGETGAWAHNDFLKLLFQFRTFSLTSIEKQWGRNQKNYGAIRSFAILMGAMSFAMPIHMARLNVQMIGKSEEERKKIADERMSAIALGRATLNYASSAGLLGDVLDVAAGFASNTGLIDEDLAVAFTGGGQGRQSVSGLVPGLGMADDLLKGTVGGQFEKLPKLLPGSNLPMVTPLVNGLTADEE
jgi:hypothetical protein